MIQKFLPFQQIFFLTDFRPRIINYFERLLIQKKYCFAINIAWLIAYRGSRCYNWNDKRQSWNLRKESSRRRTCLLMGRRRAGRESAGKVARNSNVPSFPNLEIFPDGVASGGGARRPHLNPKRRDQSKIESDICGASTQPELLGQIFVLFAFCFAV